MGSKDDDPLKEIPEIIYDAGNRISYKRGRFFGKVRDQFHCFSMT